MVYFLLFVILIAAAVLWRAAIVAVLLSVWMGLIHLPLFTWIREHPWQAVLYVAGYFVAGAIWSVAKWYFAESERVRQVRERYADHVKQSNHVMSWPEYAATRKTDPSAHTREIKWWIAFWPLSMLWTLLNDPLRRAARRIAYELRGVYQRITDRVWHDADLVVGGPDEGQH